MIDLTIMTLDSHNHKFSVPVTFTILELKEFIAAQVNVEVVQQRLIFCGRVLSNETKLTDIGINGKVMYLVQKFPSLSTTASGSSTSTTANTTSGSGQNAGLGFRGHRIINARVLPIGIPSGLMPARGLPRALSTKGYWTCNRVSLALDMICKGNDILNRLDNLLPNPPQSSAMYAEQYPEGSQQAEASSLSVPPEGVGAPESTVSQSQTDPDSVNVIHEGGYIAVIDINSLLPGGLTPALMPQVYHSMEGNNVLPIHQNATETSAESEFSHLPVGGSTNQSSAEPSPTTLSFSASSEQHSRNDATSENRSTDAEFNRLHLIELIEEINKLNERFRPFYNMYCQFIIDDPQFVTLEDEHRSLRAQSIFNGVSEVMHFMSQVYHIISDMRVVLDVAPPSSLQSCPWLHLVRPSTTAVFPFTQQPTSTQTTITSQYLPRYRVRALRMEDGGVSETSRTTDSSPTANSPSQGSTFN